MAAPANYHAIDPSQIAFEFGSAEHPVGVSVGYTPDEAAGLVSYHESGNKNIYNYRNDPRHTASGYFQITDSNWRDYAPKVGINLAEFPSAILAPYHVQRAVFDRMYAEKGFGPWANYNPRLAEALGAEQKPNLRWTPSPQAIAAEDGKSNTDVRYMDPEEYLSLLPPLRDDEATKTKRENLKTSLESGDNIETLPSLEVEPRGSNLAIVDHDGRNRAQAAIDAGLDRIPVAIRGVPEGKEFKNLVGKKSLPYSSFKPVPPAAPQQQARQLAPEDFAYGGPGVGQEQARMQALAQPQTPTGPTPTIFDAQRAATSASPSVPAKPDFYPSIVAGINRDIISPTREAYRGVNVPNPTDQATAANRIQSANALSAGQVGLTPSTPANALSSLLSAINPISSAEAAQPAATAPQAPTAAGVATIPTGQLDLGNVATIPANQLQLGSPGISGPRVPMPPGLDTAATVAGNYLSPLLTSLPSDIYAAVAGRTLNPASPAFQAARARAMAATQLPETPVGQAISNLLNSPGRLFGWAVESILGPELSGKVLPYAQVASDVLAPLSLASRPVMNVLSAPARGVLNKALQTPEIRAANAINRMEPKEIQAGGMTPTEIGNQLAQARAQGIPLAPIDLLTPGGPQAHMLGRAIEGSPEARAALKSASETRIEGTRARPGAKPAGGTLQRMTEATEKFFGAGSARDTERDLRKNMAVNSDIVDKHAKNLGKLREALKARKETLAKTVHLGPGKSPAVSRDPEVVRLSNQIKSSTAAHAAATKTVEQVSRNYDALQAGQRVLRDSTRVEDVRDFLRHSNPETKDHYYLGLSDALRHEYGKVRAFGQEPGRAGMPENIREKISAAFGSNRKAADEFLRGVDFEARISEQTRDVLRDINREGYLSIRNQATLRRIGEALTHFAAAYVPGAGFAGHASRAALYWSIRAGRQIADYLASGGTMRSGTREAIVNALVDPNARIATGGKGLLEVPARPTAGVRSINALSRASVPAAYLSMQQPASPQQ